MVSRNNSFACRTGLLEMKPASSLFQQLHWRCCHGITRSYACPTGLLQVKPASSLFQQLYWRCTLYGLFACRTVRWGMLFPTVALTMVSRNNSFACRTGVLEMKPNIAHCSNSYTDYIYICTLPRLFACRTVQWEIKAWCSWQCQWPTTDAVQSVCLSNRRIRCYWTL